MEMMRKLAEIAEEEDLPIQVLVFLFVSQCLDNNNCGFINNFRATFLRIRRK